MEVSCAIVIPVYKQQFSSVEDASVSQGCSIFENHQIYFVAPVDLSPERYSKYTSLSNVGWITFDNDFFQSTDSYNRLLMSQEFYLKFENFKYILIYQPDAWVFKNDLKFYCNDRYDYFGSPIFDKEFNLFPFGGNGGFSLRNVKASLRTVRKFAILEKPKECLSYFKKFHSGIALWIRFPLIVLRIFGYKNNSRYFIRNFGNNEDVFWSKYAVKINRNFRVAPVEEEISFSFEKEPSKLFHMNHNNLPFGCHAWEKHEPDFWKNHINWKV